MLGFDRITLKLAANLENPVWVDMITGRVFEIPGESVERKDGARVLKNLPIWDSPVMVADIASVPMREDRRAGN